MPSFQVFETWGFLWFAIGATASRSFLVGSAKNRTTVLAHLIVAYRTWPCTVRSLILSGSSMINNGCWRGRCHRNYSLSPAGQHNGGMVELLGSMKDRCCTVDRQGQSRRVLYVRYHSLQVVDVMGFAGRTPTLASTHRNRQGLAAMNTQYTIP